MKGWAVPDGSNELSFEALDKFEPLEESSIILQCGVFGFMTSSDRRTS